MRPRRLLLSAAVLAAAWLGTGFGGTGFEGTGFGGAAAQAATRTAGSAPAGRVVVLGIDGLQWSDVTQAGMPTLFNLVGQSDIASLVTRGPVDSTCPADGWLTLNTGTRTTGGTVNQYPPGTSAETALITEPQQYCTPLPAIPQSAGAYDIPSFSTYKAANNAFSYGPVFGSLTAPVTAAGGCVAASGAGALLGAADANGRVADYLGAPDGLTEADLAQCALTLVDLGGITSLPPQTAAPTPTPTPTPTPPTVRTYPYSTLDSEVAALLARLPAGTTVVVAGLDDSTFIPQLHAVLVKGDPGNGAVFDGKGLLYASSTRHAGLIQTLDLTPSLLHWIGLTPQQITAADSKAFTGALVGTRGGAPSDPAAAIVAQARLNTANVTFGQTNGRFITWMARAITILTWSAGTVFAAIRWLPERYSPGRFARRLPLLGRWRSALLWAIGGWATLLAAVAPASFLANFTHWSAAGSPGTTLFATIGVISVVLAAATLAACRLRPLRGLPLAPAGLLGLLTLAIIAIDVATGSRLQAQTPFGLSYIIAGRFYGIGNSAVGVYCAAAMIGSVWLASLLMPRQGGGAIPPHVWPRTFREAAEGWLRRATPGRLGLTRLPDASRAERRRALLTVGAVALAAVAACGYPSWGSKFGGTIAMVPGFVLLLFLVAGLRITWRKVLVVAVSGVVVVSGFAAVNYLQPAGQRSHFGNFVASLFDGTWTSTIRRKIDTNLGSIDNDWFSRQVPWLLLLALFAVVAPRLIASRSLALVYAREPFVRCALWLALITVTIGWFVDDSGVLVPKMALFLAVPLAVLSVARTLLLLPPADTESVPGGPVVLGAEDQSGGPDEAGLLA